MPDWWNMENAIFGVMIGVTLMFGASIAVLLMSGVYLTCRWVRRKLAVRKLRKMGILR